MYLLLILSLLFFSASASPLNISSTQIDQVTGQITITFNQPTNQAGIFGPQPCSNLFNVLNVNLANHSCRFATATQIFIEPPFNSQWNISTVYYIQSPSPIRSFLNNQEVSYYGPYYTTLGASSFVPSAVISGPNSVPACITDPVYFLIEAPFSAGRTWKKVTIFSSTTITVLGTSVLPLSLGDAIYMDLNSLTFTLNVTQATGIIENALSALVGSLGIIDIQLYAILENAFSVQVRTPNFTLSLASKLSSSSNILPVTIFGGLATRIHKASDSIRFSCHVQVPRSCWSDIPWSVSPSVKWNLYNVSKPNDPLTILNIFKDITSTEPEFVIPPHFFKPLPDQEFTYFGINVDLSASMYTGSATVYVAITHSDPVLVLNAPSWLDNETDLIVDARSSCDPDYTPGCNPISGVSPPGSRFGNLNLGLYLTVFNGEEYVEPSNVDFRSEVEDPRDGTLDGYWKIGRPGIGKYRLYLRANSTKYTVNQFYLVKTIEITPATNGICKVPDFSLPAILSYQEGFGSISAPSIVPYVINAINVSQQFSIQWTMNNPSFPNNSAIPANFAPFTNRPAISILPSALFPGFTYTFKLSVQACSSGSVSSSEVTFSVNVPPFGGYVGISPYVGQAYNQIFTISTGGWSVIDPSASLPLQFEYKFNRIGANAAVTIASKSRSQLLQTPLSSPDLICDPHLNINSPGFTENRIVVFCYDALGALSSAISDPFIVTPLFRPPANSLILTSSQDKINTIINNALPSITDELARYNQLGYSLEQQLQSMISISNEASVSQCIARGLPLFIQNTLLNWRNQVQSSNLASLNQTRQNAQQHNSPPDLSEFAVELTLFAAIMSGAYASLSPSDFELATTLLTLLIGDAGTIQKLNPSDNPVDFDVGSVFLDILGGISLSVGFQKDIREGRNPLNPEISMEDSAEVHATVKQKDSFSTSLLDPSPVPVCNYECQAVSTVQQAIRQLVSVLMINFQPGSPPRTANAKLIELNMYREYTSFLGDSDGVQSKRSHEFRK